MPRQFNAILLVAGALALVFAWLINISVQTDLIPTIVNGIVIATSTAIIFTGIFFTLGCSNKWLELQKKNHPKIILGFLGLSSFFIIITFLFLISNNFEIALKLSFTGLILASGTFMSLMALLIEQLGQRKSESNNQQ
jgi:hypothetical protein